MGRKPECEVATLGTHGASGPWWCRWAARIRRGGPGESAPTRRSPMSIKGPFRKRDGCAMKVVGLTRGDLRGCSGMPGHAWRARRVGRDGDAREGVARRGEVSRGRITSGIDCRWEGPNAKPRCRTLVLVGMDVDRSQPRMGPARESQRVKPEDPAQSAVHPRRAATPHLTPPRRACGSSSWPATISPRRSDASSRTPVPQVSTG